MILADDSAILQQLGAQDAPTQDQFPAAPPARAAKSAPTVPGELTAGAALVDNAADYAGGLAHDLMQPGSGRAISSAFQAGMDRAREVDNFNADDFTMARAYEPVIEALNKERGFGNFIPNPYLESTFSTLTSPEAIRRLAVGLPLTRDGLENDIWARVAELRKTNPELTANIPGNRDELLADVLAEQRTALHWSDQLAGGSRLGGVAEFAGQAAGSFFDPPNILATMLGAPASSSLVKTFLIEGGLNTALDAVGLPSRAARYRNLGQPLSATDIGAELAADFTLGGALPTGIKAAMHALAPDVRTAGRVVEDELTRADENPHAGDAEGRDLMRQGALTSMAALDEGRPEFLPDTTPQLERALNPSIDAQRRRQGFAVESFDPAVLGTDAAAMQYKGGGDAQGVTDRLQGVTQWDPAKAGLSLIWERDDGKLVVADGHQRLGLAQRLAAAGQDNVNLYGIRYREADGFTAQDMRVIAALKNIAEGTGTGLDAARLLRDAPEGVRELPPRSPLVRQAKDLASLSDDAFGMALNGTASERDAAIVGRFVHDKDLQAPILAHLARETPDTAEEAELFVRQAMAAGATHEVQTDMFGNFIKSDLILPQRVKILKGALTALRKDKALFSTLTDRASAIEAAGNALNAAENEARRETAARAFATLKALAERKGPISDALQQAAEAAARTGDRRTATAGFVQNVRDAVARGDLDRERLGDAIGDVEPAATDVAGAGRAEPDPALESLSLFGDPVEKPEAFQQQTHQLAEGLVPVAEKPVAEVSEGQKPPEPEFGPAQADVEAMRALDQEDMFPNANGEGEITVRDARRQMERDARAVEALRRCGGFDAV